MRKFALVLTLVCMAVSAQATTIFSDGFNFGGTTAVPDFVPIPSGGVIGPWAVTGHETDAVDWMGTHWQTAEGNGSLDLAGLAGGTISTTLNTVGGQSYSLSFWMAPSPINGAAVQSLVVNVGPGGAILSETFSIDKDSHSFASMGWVREQTSFVAAGSSTVLTFTSLQQDAFGPALDLVTVDTPEPATYAFALLGLAGIGLFRRRRSSV